MCIRDSQVAKSLVFNEPSDLPTMKCVWSEEVGAPREAKVIRHEVEPLQMNTKSDFVRVGFVKSFAL
mgnify:FL=1